MRLSKTRLSLALALLFCAGQASPTFLRARDSFNLGEAEVSGKREPGLEIEEVGDTSIPDFIFKRDLYTSQDERTGKTLDGLSRVGRPPQKRPARKTGGAEEKGSRFKKRELAAGVAAFDTAWARGEFAIANRAEDDFTLGLSLFQTGGHRSRTAEDRFGADLGWTRKSDASGDLTVTARGGFNNEELPGPESSPQQDARVEDSIREILLNYELTQRAASRIRVRAGSEGIGREVRGNGAKSTQDATLARLEAEYFDFVQNRLSIHLGVAVRKEEITDSLPGRKLGLDHQEFSGGFEGILARDWTYFAHGALRNYAGYGRYFLPSLLVSKKFDSRLKVNLGLARDEARKSATELLRNYEDLAASPMAAPIRDRIEVQGCYEAGARTSCRLGLFSDTYDGYWGVTDSFDPALGIWRYTLEAIPDAKILGLSAGLSHRLGREITFSSDLLFQRGDDDSLNSDLPFLPESEHTFKLRYQHPKGWEANASRVLRGSMKTRRGDGAPGTGQSDLTHLGLGYKKDEHLHLDFKVLNLYDHRHLLRREQPGRGREFQLELRYIY